MANFDKLNKFIKGNKEPLESVDMKKASKIRKEHPKYETWPARAIMNDKIWKHTNTNGKLV